MQAQRILLKDRARSAFCINITIDAHEMQFFTPVQDGRTGKGSIKWEHVLPIAKH